MSTPSTAPSQGTVIQEIDELVADILGAVKTPSITTIMVVVTQIIAFIVSFGIIGPTEQGLLISIITGAVNVGILIVNAIKTYSAHKTVSAITQAKLDLLASGWPNPPAPGTAHLGRVRGG